MNRFKKFTISGLVIFMGVLTMQLSPDKTVIKDYQDINTVKKQLLKLAPVEISYDENLLSSSQKVVLSKLVEAAKYMDEIFLRQVYSKNPQIRSELQSGKNPDYKTLLDYFTVNFGPFDRLNGNAPFINLTEEKPAGANYYPQDLSKEEFENWIKTHPEDEEAFTSNFTIIRRRGNQLVAISYSEAYRESLEPAAKLLKEAAQSAENPSLKKYLNSRADAFLSNDYFQSDMDWMDLKDHTIEVVIGPYEVMKMNSSAIKLLSKPLLL
ncbi:MAG: hypothetical protein ACE5GL_10085, partial [Calditrichia bacterium]